MRRVLSPSTCLLLALPTAAAAEPAASGAGWNVTAAPYLWAARLDGDAKVGGVKADVDVSFKDTLENLNVAGMALIEARRGRFGFAVNPLFVRTESDAASGPLEADNTTDIATMGASVFYRAVELDLGRNDQGDPQSLAIEPLVGARLNYLRGEVDTKLDAFGRNVHRQFDENQTWVDPIVGVNAILRLSEHWGVRGEADIGGFGVGSDLTWNAQAVVTYGFTVWGYDAFAAAGYRALYWDYKEGGFEWDVTMSGPMLGAGVRF